MTDSPGNLPTSLGGAVWTGEIKACNIDWPPPWQPWITPTVAPHSPLIAAPVAHYQFTPATLSDEDVDRIARRVVELIRAGLSPAEPPAGADGVVVEPAPEATTKREIHRRSPP